MNNVNIVGRWVADVSETKAVGDTVKAEGRIAVDTFKKDVAHFFTVEMWGKTAEIASQYCKKGNFAIISGRLVQDTWEKDGEKREKVYITAERIDLPPKTGGDDTAKSAAPAAKPTGKPASGKRTVPVDDDDGLF